MNKNSILAIICSAVVLVGYICLNTFVFNKPTHEHVEENSSLVETVETEESSEQTSIVSEIPEPELSEIPEEIEVVEEEIFTVQTKKVKVQFTNKGGDVISFQLLDHEDSRVKSYVEMAENISESNRAFALSFGTGTNQIINDFFTTEILPTDENGLQSIVFSKKYKDFTLIKKYSFMPDDYMFKLNIQVKGNENFNKLGILKDDGTMVAYTLRTAPQIGPYYDTQYDYRDFLGHNGSKVKEKSLASNNNYKKFDGDYNWSGIGGKYFCELIIPEVRDIIIGSYYTSVKGDYQNSVAQSFVERKQIENKEVDDVYYIYVGSRNERELKKYATAANNDWNFGGRSIPDALKSGGMLGWLESILKWMLELIYKLIPNWGVSIIITTIIFKALLFPLTLKQSLGTLKMKEMQPKLQEIQTRYKENPQKLQEETAKLYQKGGYNPMSGCLALIVQMMALFAMYRLFNNYFEFRGAGFIPGWIDDLSIGDSILTWKREFPFIGNHLRILPIIYLISQLFYGKITQMGATAGQNAGTMKFMTYGLPIIFSFMFYNAPAGLLLFWTVSNLLTMIQQLVINKVMANKTTQENPNSNLKHFTKKGKKR